MLGAIGFLGFAAITILGELGDRVADRKAEQRPAGAAGGARPGPVVATSLDANKALTLPAQFDAVGRGAGGRYLFLRLPLTSQIAVFDPNKGAVIQYVNVGERDVLFAAGAAKLFVYKPKAQHLERYDLVTWKLDAPPAKPAGTGGVDALAIGAAADGPLYAIRGPAGGAGEVRLIDPDTLTARGVHPVPAWKGGGLVHARASDDGDVLSLYGANGTAAVRFPAEGEPEIVNFAGVTPPPRVAPAPDGSVFYASHGVYLRDGTRLKTPSLRTYAIPADQGSGLYLRLPQNRDGRFEDAPEVCFADTRTAAGTLAGVEIPGALRVDEPNGMRVATDQRFHLWPAAGLVAVLPPSNGIIELSKVDVADVLKQSGRKDYIVFGSDPPRSAAVGKPWKYSPEVWAPREANLTLVDGPRGMTLRNGELTWAPTDRGDAPVEVLLRATVPGVDRHADQQFRIVVAPPGE
jgi:hypothetical protein